MLKPSLGIKRLCTSCGTKFYDLSKKPIVCPKCLTAFTTPSATAPKPRWGVKELRPDPEPIAATYAPHAQGIASGPEDEVTADTEAGEQADNAVLIVPDDEDEDIGDILGGGKGEET